MTSQRVFPAAMLLSFGLIVGCARGDASPKPAGASTQASASAELLKTSFDDAADLPAGWKIEGDVTVDGQDAFDGSRSLVLSRDQAAITRPVYAVSPLFPVEQGGYDVVVSAKTDLQSPDNSYNGVVSLELTDTNGKTANGPLVAEIDGTRNWQRIARQVDVPASYTHARVRVQINKAAGRFWVDGLSVKRAATSGKDAVVNRLFFDTAQMGNLLYPADSRVVKLTTWTMRPLEASERDVSCVVRDYFGAEQAKPLSAILKEAGRKDAFYVYEGSVDLAPVTLEIGRYYELHGTITKSDNTPFSNYTSFAILPEAPANSYKPETIPFTARTWDARIPEAQPLTHRIGIRIGGLWGRWSADAPYEANMPNAELVQKLGMGIITGTPAHAVEMRSAGWEKYTDEVMRQGTRNFLKKYGHIRPLIFNLGNEPHNKGDEVKANVAAYKAVYEEVKKFDPSITVVSTSVGPEEDFFKHGFGNYCDAYDFHVYGDSAQIRDVIENQYPALFAKYGQKKPIWCTEFGLNSHGMARLPVASEMVKKFANFFAAGGAVCSWFDIMYPDPDATITGSGSEAHNIFDCRYNKYAPKLEAISNYNVVNTILDKKFIEEKVYEKDIRAFLFRNNKGEALQVWYKDKGRADVGIPMPGVEKVKVIRIDGTLSELDARKQSVTLTINEDPILLLYGGAGTLPTALAKPVAGVAISTRPIVSGREGRLDVGVYDESVVRDVELALPFGWTSDRTEATYTGYQAFKRFEYKLRSPAQTTAREASVTVRVRDAEGRVIGEVYDRPTITGAITMSLLPTPATDTQPVGVTLDIRNNSADKQSVKWDVAMLGMKPVLGGKYDDKLVSSDAYFASTPSGEVTLAGGEGQNIFVPLAKVDPHAVYYMKATVKDTTGRQVVDERPVGGFVAVPKIAKGAIKIDGDLNDDAWKLARVQKIDRADEYFDFKRKDGKQRWTGPQDLSAEIRYLWDDEHLYVGVTVVDDIAGGLKADDGIWAQDSLQFLVDPSRTLKQKVGKYDIGLGLGSKGPQAWCFLSADSAASPAGLIKDTTFVVKPTKPGTGNTTYEISFPWSRFSPFKPAPSANLGFTMIVNEDDGEGRDSFLTWFGNAHSKDVDTVGDLILQGP